jgi:hypothetical protein
MTKLHRVLTCLGLLAMTSPAYASLLPGGSGTGYTSNASLAAWPGSPVYTSIAAPSGATTNQGFAGVDTTNANTLTILSEVVTPGTTFTLGSIAIEASGGAPTNNAMSLHLFPFTSSTTPTATLASNSGAFYTVGTDLLGGGAGLNFTFPGFTGNQVVTFDFDTVGTNDQPTLTAGTSYAVELWTANGSIMTWLRNGGSPADPGGQMMGTKNPTLNSGSRNTIAALGLAGGSPRIAAVALNAVPEPGSLGLLGIGAAGLLARRRRSGL